MARKWLELLNSQQSSSAHSVSSGADHVGVPPASAPRMVREDTGGFGLTGEVQRILNGDTSRSLSNVCAAAGAVVGARVVPPPDDEMTYCTKRAMKDVGQLFGGDEMTGYTGAIPARPPKRVKVVIGGAVAGSAVDVPPDGAGGCSSAGRPASQDSSQDLFVAAPSGAQPKAANSFIRPASPAAAANASATGVGQAFAGKQSLRMAAVARTGSTPLKAQMMKNAEFHASLSDLRLSSHEKYSQEISDLILGPKFSPSSAAKSLRGRSSYVDKNVISSVAGRQLVTACNSLSS